MFGQREFWKRKRKPPENLAMFQCFWFLFLCILFIYCLLLTILFVHFYACTSISIHFIQLFSICAFLLCSSTFFLCAFLLYSALLACISTMLKHFSACISIMLQHFLLCASLLYSSTASRWKGHESSTFLRAFLLCSSTFCLHCLHAFLPKAPEPQHQKPGSKDAYPSTKTSAPKAWQQRRGP